MLEEKIKKGKLYLSFRDFGDGKMDHIFSSRQGWSREDIFRDLAEVLEVDQEKIYRGTQVHGDTIVLVGDEGPEAFRDRGFDGLITNRRGLALVTYHADCTPLYFYDSRKAVIGMAHSGWRGSLLNIGGKMVERFTREFGSRPEDIEVAIGPAICGSCYQVQEDVYSQFMKEYRPEEILSEREGQVYLDLARVNRINLLRAGIGPGNIHESNFCTACNIDKLYSYRLEHGRGRMIGSIILR